MKIVLDSFVLEEYDEENLEHVNVIYELNKDGSTKKFLGDINYMLMRIKIRSEENKYNRAFIAYFGDHPIGYISLSYINNEYQIASGILNEFRRENLASSLLQDFSYYLLDNFEDIDKLVLRIDEDNIGSQMVASLVGYEKENRVKYTMKR